MSSKSPSASLKSLAFFAGLPETGVWHLARLAEQRSLAEGEVLFEEGHKREIFITVLSGRLAIEHTVDGRTIRIAELGAGEVIGESILLEEGEHSSTGRALEPTEILFLRKEPLMKLLKDQPALYAALLGRAAKIMSVRIRSANANLRDTRTDWPTERGLAQRWLDATAELAATVGAEKALQAAREAVAAGRDVRSLRKTPAAR